MYINKLNRFDNVPAISEFIRKYSFAILISQQEGGSWATHLPLELETNDKGEQVLWGHIAKANAQWKNFGSLHADLPADRHGRQGEEQVLAIFQGPQHYISPSWYNHVNVPTWNYIAVHVYGRIKILDDATVHEHLRRMTHKYEVIAEKPVSVETMPTEFVRKEMKGLVGFEISIDKIEGNWKLSQNRDDENFKNIIAELEKLNDSNSRMIANEMKKQRNL